MSNTTARCSLWLATVAIREDWTVMEGVTDMVMGTDKARKKNLADAVDMIIY